MIFPSLKEEALLFRKGYRLIAGIDEAGRGPIAGPVVAGIVIPLEQTLLKWQKFGINDSKKLAPKKRRQLFEIIKRESLLWGRGVVSEKIIDRVGIRQATFLAMKKAVEGLKVRPEFLLIDGKDTLRDFPFNQKAIVNGDERVLIIAAASIIAKETRDDIMRRYHLKYPAYGFAQHKGYGTKMHFEMIKKYGPCKIHRRSFHPIKDIT